jgi:hypothetical protein
MALLNSAHHASAASGRIDGPIHRVQLNTLAPSQAPSPDLPLTIKQINSLRTA